MSLAGSWGPILIAVISAAGTILVTVLKMRGDKEIGVPGMYQGLIQEMRAMHADELERLNKRLDEQGGRIEAIEGEMNALRRKFRDAMAYIRHLRSIWPDRSSLPSVPDHLQDEIDF